MSPGTISLWSTWTINSVWITLPAHLWTLTGHLTNSESFMAAFELVYSWSGHQENDVSWQRSVGYVKEPSQPNSKWKPFELETRTCTYYFVLNFFHINEDGEIRTRDRLVVKALIPCQRTNSTQKLKLLGKIPGYDLHYSLIGYGEDNKVN